jgi:hypothetical protein
VILTNSTFKNIKSEGNGSVLNGVVGEGSEIKILGSTFETCESEEYGGAIYVVNDGGSFSINNNEGVDTSFKSCSAKKMDGESYCGGAIYLSLEGDSDITPERLNLNNIANEEKVNFLFITIVVDFRKDWLHSTLNFVQTNMNKDADYIKDLSNDNLLGVATTSSDIIPLKYFWMKIESLFVGKDGKDNNMCGFETYPCKTLDTSVIRVGEEDCLFIYIIDETDVIGSVQIGIKVSIRNDPKDETRGTINVKPESFINIISIVTLKKLSFSLPATINEEKEALISIKVADSSADEYVSIEDSLFGYSDGYSNVINVIEGNLIVDGCVFEKLILKGSAINIAGGRVEIKNTVFSEIKSDGDHGAAISCSGDVVVEGCEFKNVLLINFEGLGGAIYADVSIGSFIIQKEVTGGFLSNEDASTRFENCGVGIYGESETIRYSGFGGAIYIYSSGNEENTKFIFNLGIEFEGCHAGAGENIFAYHDNSDDNKITFNNLILKEKFKHTSFSSESDISMVGVVASDESTVIPLRYYLVDRLPVLYVADNGRNLPICGSFIIDIITKEEYKNPCRTIQYAVSLSDLIDTDPKKVEIGILNNVPLGDCVNGIEYVTRVYSHQEKEEETHTLMTISIDSTNFQVNIFTFSGDLTLEELVIVISNTTATSSFFFIGDASLTVKSCVFKHVDEDGTIMLTNPFITVGEESSGNITFSNTSFIRFSYEGNGSALSADLSANQVLTIESCVFTNVTVIGNNTFGGAIYSVLDKESSLIIDGCTFSRCTAGSRGGAISVYLKDGSNSNVLKLTGDLKFIDCTAMLGYFIYLDGQILSSVVNKDSFSYSYSLAEPIELAGINGHNFVSVVYLYVYLCPLRIPREGLEEGKPVFDCDLGCVEYYVCSIRLLLLFIVHLYRRI